jgi:hypothetical protein
MRARGLSPRRPSGFSSHPRRLPDGSGRLEENPGFVDLGLFKAIGPHVNWRAVLYPDEA